MESRVTILGAGESGTGAALLAKSKGYSVFVSDSAEIPGHFKDELTRAGIEFEENGHTMDRVVDTDLVIKSPGIPETATVVQACQANGISVIDELEFAARFTRAKLVAITGTNGKTTTTLLTYHLLKEAGLNVGLAGNVGHSLAKQVMEDLHDYYVIEMSSFQLDGTVEFKPDIAVLLNITPDHMDRYNNKIENYVNSKFRITKNQTSEDHFLYYGDDALIAKSVDNQRLEGQLHPITTTNDNTQFGWFEDGNMNVKFLGRIYSFSMNKATLRGEHNALNMLAAISSSLILGVDEEDIRQGLATFKNAPHRMEYVATINEVDFINDSKATNVDATKYALDSFDESLVWIAGGVDKGNDYTYIMETVNAKVKALVCLGKDNTKLRDAFHNDIINLLETDDMRMAVRSAMEYADAHDVVLLSPACASFDLFKNYEDRGDQFKEAVLELKREFENKSLEQ